MHLQAILLLGVSGSGKTTMAEAISKKFKLVLSVDSEFSRASRRISLSQIKSEAQPDCLLVFDDVISPEKERTEALKSLLLYQKHHLKYNIIVILHSVFRNNTSHLINHFDQIVLTRTSGNAKNFFELVNVLKMDREEGKKTWQSFLARPERYPYLCLNTSTLSTRVATIETFELEGEKPSGTEAAAVENARKRIESIVGSCCKDPEVALVLYDHIMVNCPISNLDHKDLSMKLWKKSTRKVLKISLCDLLYQATQDSTPTPEVLLLFSELQKKFSIPRMLIKNPKFKINKESFG